MAINKNHLFDDLNGIKCAIVETEVSAERVNFLKSLLEFNRFTVVVIPSPPAKGAAAAAPATDAPADSTAAAPSMPEKFTVGVTDSTFNAINAIYGRLLHTPDKRVVTMAFWLQKEKVSNDHIPYFDRKI